LVSLLDSKRHERQVSRPLNCHRELPLMPGTIPRNTSRDNLPTLRNQVAQPPDVFVINERHLIGTEATDLFAQKSLPPP
jgi:hypothetical protein